MFTRDKNNDHQNAILYGICVDVENTLDETDNLQAVVDWFRSDECREMVGEEDYPEYLEAVEFVLSDDPDWADILKLWQETK